MPPTSSLRDPAPAARAHRTPALSTGPDPVLDRAADVVRHLLGASAAMITVVGPDVQTFVGASGPTPLVDGSRQVPASASFCVEVVADGRPLVVPDALDDVALRDHPALAASGVVAYCGVPLHDDDGTALGTVCAVDDAVHHWSDDDVAALERFSALLTRDLSLRRARAEAVRREALLDDTRALLTHDLRDALHSIGIAAELLPAVPDLPSRAVDLAGAIARRSAAATDVLGRLLPDDRRPPGAAPPFETRVRDVVDEYDRVLADVDVRLRTDGALRAEDRVLVPEGMGERCIAGLVRMAAAGTPDVIEVRLSVADGDLVIDVRHDGTTGPGAGGPDELGPTVAAYAADAWEGSFTSSPGHYRLALPLAPRQGAGGGTPAGRGA